MELSSPTVKADINVTPLVDVVLVLLIIFMVVTPMMQKGKAVRLPQTSNPAQKAEEKNQVLVVVTDTHQYFVDTPGEKVGPISETDFNGRVKEIFERNQSSGIVIKADSRLTYGDVKKTMMKIKDAGFQSVGLIAERKQQTASDQ